MEPPGACPGPTGWFTPPDHYYCTVCSVLYVLYCRVVLVCDGWNHRVLVLDPRDGSHLQTIPFREDLGDVKHLCLYEDGAILCHTAGSSCKISHLSLT